MVNALLILGFSIFSILLFLFIWFIRNRNKILADKNKEIAFLNENLKSKAITNQNITEAALHKSQQELSLIYNHTQDPMGLFQCDPLGNFLIESINQVYIDHLMGEGIISRDQSLEGLNLSVFLKTYLKLSAEDVAECMQYFNTARLSKRRVSYESITYSALNRDNIINKVTLSPIVDDATGLCNRIIFVLHGIKALLPSEAHSKTLLEHSPIIIWDEDFSAVKRYFDALSNDEIANLNTYFDQNPKELERLASLIIVKNVNQKSAGFYNRESKEAHIEEIPLYFVDESWKVLKEEFIALAQGATTFESEIPIKKLNGELVNLIITLSIPPEFKDTWKSVIVSFIDITQQKKAALELQVSEAHSKALFEHSPIIIWDEDLSLLKNYFDTLSKKEIANLDTFFDQNPKEFKRLAALIKVKNLNQKGLDFYELENKDAQINAMPFYFADESWEALKAEFIALAQGAATYEGEIPIIKPNGDAAQFIIKTSIPPQYRETWKSVIVSFIDITERKKTEKKLKQSKTELKTQLQHKQLILDTMLDGYTLTDKRANIIEANPAYCNMIGYTKEELLKMNIKQLSKQFSQTDIDHKSLDLVKGKGAHYEDILIRKDGTPIVVDIKTSFMQFNGIQRFATFIRDITAEKAVQQELEYRSSFEKLLANLSSGFLKISLGKIDPGIQNAIQQVCEFSGFDRIFIALFSEKQDTGSVLYEWHNSSRNSLKEDFQNVPMESFPWLFKTLINNEAILVKNQDDLPAEAINMRNIFQKMDIHSLVQVPMVWKEKIIGFICVDSRTEKQNLSTALTTLLRFTGEMITNVLQRKNKEEEIKTQLQRNQLILESTLDGYILFDKNANIIDVNQAYCKLVGYAKEELVKMNILDLDKISSKLETQARLKNVVENDGARYETRHERKDGTKVDLDTNLGTMIFNDKLLFAAFVRDITAQKAAQQELEHRLKFKRLLATLSTQFLNLSLEGIDEGIDEALKAICEFTDFDRSFVVLFSEEHKTCSAFYEWNRQGINANIDHFQNIPFKFFPGLIKKLKNNEYVLLKTNNDLLPEAEAFNTILQNLNIQSVMYAPMTWQGEVLGFIGFDSERVVKDWPEDLVILLRFAGEMIINILHRKKEKRALIASEQQLSIIYNNSIDYIGLIRVYPNNKFIIESINQPAQHFLKSATGIKSDDIIGVEISSLLKMFFTDTRPKVEQMMYNIRRVAKEKKNFIFQDHLPSPLSSNKKTYETAISPILKDDLCVQVLYVVKDITKEAKAKDKLIASEKHLKSIFDGSTDQMAILTINAYGELIFEDTNKSFKTAWVKANYGLDLESVYGKNLTYFLGEVLGFSEEKTKEYLQYSKLVTSQKKTINIEGNYLMMNNKKYFLDITITAILNEENICTKLLLVIRDNTLKHRAKENMIFKILETEDRERSRFAKELHDSLGQNLTAASLTFNQVKKSTDELSPDTRKSFETGIKFLKEAIDESRNIAHNLMPQAIKDFGYVLAVEGLLEDLSQTTGIEFTFYNNLNDERLSSDHELSLFRITQEAIQNILKHAEATKVTIQLIKHIDSIILSIEDNGKGFDSKTLKTKSFGLNSMKARSSALSGVIDIDGFPGKGVLITLEIPITALSQ